jgi:FkbM family methyltransferase
MHSQLVRIAQGVLRRRGAALVRYDARHFSEVRRANLLASRGISVAVDVGANEGHYALALRRHGYEGRIVSFEPQSGAFTRLAERAERDIRWECSRIALGRASGEAVLNLSANSSSSSILAMNERHEVAAPESAYVGCEVVSVATLDSLARELFTASDRCLLKIDVQGLELDVLRGAERSLEQVQVVEVELSLVSLYRGAPLLPDVLDYLQTRDFALFGLDPVLLDPSSGAVLQLDGLFARLP